LNDGKPPALKRAAAVVAVKPAICFPERILNGIFRVGMIPDDGVCIARGLL
jgi:hypothetical protein